MFKRTNPGRYLHGRYMRKTWDHPKAAAKAALLGMNMDPKNAVLWEANVQG